MSTYVQCICNYKIQKLLSNEYRFKVHGHAYRLTVTRKRRLLVGFVLGFFLFGYFWWGVELNVIEINALMIITL